MTNYAIMRIEKRKLPSVGRINKHHERQKEEYKSNPDIDWGRTGLNYHIVQPPGPYREAALTRIEQAGARRRKDSVVLQDCFVGGTPDWLKEKGLEEQRAYFSHAYQFFEDNFGKENIISAVVHMDEATPHMHLCFVPITPKGRLSSKDVIGGPQGLVRWQDRFYEHMHQRYPDLSRGLPRTQTHRKHVPPYMFKLTADLYKHYDEIMSRTYLRGDMYYADLGRGVGSEQKGYRPVVIIQNNKGNKHSPTVIVAAISSKVGIKPKLPTHYFINAECGLERPSIVLMEQIRTLDKQRLIKYIGRLTKEHIQGMNHALAVSVDLTHTLLKKECRGQGGTGHA